MPHLIISPKLSGLHWASVYVFAATNDDIKRTHIRGRIQSYMDRAEEIKRLVQKEKDGKYTTRLQHFEKSLNKAMEQPIV